MKIHRQILMETITVNRFDFGVGPKGEFIVGKEIEIQIRNSIQLN